MADALELGEVDLPDWRSELGVQQLIPFREVERTHGRRAAFSLLDINFARTWIRKRRYGEADPDDTLYRVTAKWPTGESAEWEFGGEVGWPTEDGKARDWKREWEQNFGGVA